MRTNHKDSHDKIHNVLRKKYPYNCFVMTLYQSLLMALVSIPFSVYSKAGA